MAKLIQTAPRAKLRFHTDHRNGRRSLIFLNARLCITLTPLLQQDVGIDAAKAKRTDRRAPRCVHVTPGPFAGLGQHFKRTIGERQGAGGTLKIGCRW